MSMHLCMFLSMVNLLLRRSASLDLAIYSVAVLWVGWRCGYSSHIFPDFYHGWISTHFCCFVLQVIPNLGYFLALDSHPCLICIFSWELFSVFEGPLPSKCLQRFRRGFRSGQRTFPIAPVQSGLYVPSNILGDLRSFCRLFFRLIACLEALLSGGSFLYLNYLWW